MSLENEFYIVRKSLEQSLRELPPLPTAVTRVLQEMQNPEPSAANVEKIISGDQALASKMLRVVNSAYYGLSRQVTNVGQAIIILGLQQVRNIVLSVGTITAFNAKTPKQIETMRQFWRHSFGSATTATLVARKLGWERKPTETLFTGGILHDIGRLFLFCNFANTYDRLLEIALSKGQIFEGTELAMLGTTHAEIGGKIAEKWGLPESIVACIKNHEGPFGEEIDPLTGIIHFADCLNKFVYFGDNEIAIAKVDPKIEEWLGLTEEDLDAIRAVTLAKVDEASEMYGMVS